MDPLAVFDRAKKALSEIQISEVLRERLSFAIEQGTVTEKQIVQLRQDLSETKAELTMAKLEAQKRDQELEALREAMKEDVVIHRTVEFRRGRRTDFEWQAFCPKCHLPAMAIEAGYYLQCSDGDCKFVSRLLVDELQSAIGQLNAKRKDQ